jgi:hypothetical protein
MTASVRVRIGLLLLLLFSAVSSVQLIRRAFEASRAPDQVTAYTARFDQVRARLPTRGVVGYVGDPTVSAGPPARDADLLYFQRFLWTQYAVAPVILLHRRSHAPAGAPFEVYSRIAGDAPRETPQPDVVIGDFHRPDAPRRLPGFTLAEDFGEGVALFLRAAE